MFDERRYLKENPDVLEAINRGEFDSGLQHYLMVGHDQARELFVNNKGLVRGICDGLNVIIRNMLNPRVAFVLARFDARVRYRQTSIGQWWSTINYFISVLMIGLVFGGVFGGITENFFIFISINLLVWFFISNAVQESSHALTGSASLINAYRIELPALVVRVVARNFLVLLRCLPIPAGILYYTNSGISLEQFGGFLAGLSATIVCLYSLCYTIAVLASIWKFLEHVFAGALQILFYITPIIWEFDRISDTSISVMLSYNPLKYLFDVTTGALLGRPLDLSTLLWVAGTCATLLFIAAFTHFLFEDAARYRLSH